MHPVAMQFSSEKYSLRRLSAIMMNCWYSVSLGDGMWAPVLFAQIEEIFHAQFDAAGKPVEMAVFTRSESEGRLQCEVIVYFFSCVWRGGEIICC